jgi:hypothetical protein
MGVTSASQVLHRLVGLSLDHVVEMLRSSMLKRMQEKTVSQLFILTQVGTASETSWWRGRRASSGIDESRWLFEESRI